jgi:hypothetical protein
MRTRLLICCLFAITSFLYAQKIYKLNDVGYITIPEEMELQEGIYKKMAEEYIKLYDFEISENRVVFQQKGLNKFNQKGFQSYARIIIETEYGDFDKDIFMTSQELKEANTIMRNSVYQNFKNTNLKLISWYGTSVTSINGKSALKVSYLRQLSSNPYVIVNMYIIPNGSKKHIITLSYRQNEEKIWKPIYSKVLKSIKIE